ncbi:aryl-alcohol dehydrogenase AAD14 [Pseudovirgaria hyperparasitica]|uniref:Aryl-alcohol dehydrogenase AAD14 n=1 Tax=Pseudovirgaria hyperparasitica TaxID=470096 RepID=A0A6A6WFF0_9PEZI|nr:aryl-alcohol dehydrogenase AAD14 [Pseudovirgaria hyperparasitica]KAF2759841.1 aryl-alcohol dehydrogenase AAD14 [Pseudovirgaria hyperparasitica]
MSHTFQPAPEPPSELGRYRILSSTAGVRVSPLAIGAMSIGKAWEKQMGSMSKEASYKLFDHYVAKGGNFIDTANNYQDEESEEWIGDWMAEREIRDQMFIATKYTTDFRGYKIGKGNSANYSGNHRKSLHLSVRESLKKLKTDYIDLLYLHWWDWTTSIPEIMDSLHMLVEQGKVLYLGISDTPAWVVSACNEYAKANAKTPFSVYQGRWNILARDFERDIIPMARHYGMALCPWDVIGGGRFKSSKQMEELEKSGSKIRSFVGGEQTEEEAKASATLEKIGNELGASLSAVALAYTMQKTRGVFPLVGGRKTEHLDDNIKALSLHLSDAQIEEIEKVKPFDLGFPMSFISDDPTETGVSPMLVAASAQIAWQPKSKPIGHQ